MEPNQTSQDAVNAKTAGDGMDNDVISSTDAETSSWESEPNTARSSRQYYPLKEKTSNTSFDNVDNPEHATNGIIPDENPVIVGDPGLLSSQYLKKTLGVEKAETPDDVIQGSGLEQDDEEETENQNGLQRDGRPSLDGMEERDWTATDSLMDRDEQSEDVIKLDLTKEAKDTLFGDWDVWTRPIWILATARCIWYKSLLAP